MKLSVERSVLLKALGHLQNVVERKNTIPILSNVKLETGSNSLNIMATDMELTVTEKVIANVEKEGKTTVSAHILYDIVRKLPEGSEILMEANEDRSMLIIKAGNAKFSLSCLPVEDYPVMESAQFDTKFTIPAKELYVLLSKAQFAISTEETRYYLNGIYFHIAPSNGKLCSVATDGHRLAKIEAELPEGASGMEGVIIPRKTIAELLKLVEQGYDIDVSVSKTKIQFICGDAILLSKLIDGTFPDYEKVIPQNNDKTMEVETKALSSSIDRVSTVSSDRIRSVKASIEKGFLTLSASSSEQGSATDTLEVTYSADKIEIGFNARYLIDILSQVEDDNVQFILADSSSPVLVRSAEDMNVLYVVMPMRV